MICAWVEIPELKVVGEAWSLGGAGDVVVVATEGPGFCCLVVLCGDRVDQGWGVWGEGPGVEDESHGAGAAEFALGAALERGLEHHPVEGTEDGILAPWRFVEPGGLVRTDREVDPCVFLCEEVWTSLS